MADKIYFHDNFSINSSIGKILDELTKDIKKSKNGYAGFRTRNSLKRHLRYNLFHDDYKIKSIEINKKRTLKIVSNSLKNYHKIFRESVEVFIFPSFSNFVKENMSGVDGCSPHKQVVHIYLNPSKTWTKMLEDILYHEFCHCVAYKYLKWTKLVNILILEGLAENFREYFTKRKTPWSSALSPHESKIIFLKIRRFLNIRNQKIYKELFFIGKKYPKWAGYSIGYHIIKSYIKNHRNYNWKHLIKTPPIEFLHGSGFLEA